MGKLRKESSRYASGDDDHVRPTYNSPSLSLVEIWRSHDGLSLRQRSPPSRPRGRKRAIALGNGIVEFLTLLHWERQYHILFFALVHGEEGMAFGLFVLSLSKRFICFSKGP